MKSDIVKVKMRRFIARYFSNAVYIIYWLKFKVLNFNKNPPVVILTPGKVGSSSVYYTLREKLKKNNIFHIHFLSKEGIKRAKQIHLNSDRKSLPLHLITSELLFDKLKKYDKQVKVITIIREPISRTVSSFFQNLDFYKDSIEDSKLALNESKAVNLIEKKISNSVLDINKWLNSEIKENFNIDIYNKKFPKEKYVIFKNQKVDLLLLKMEDLDDVFTNSTKDFFDIKEGIILENHNVGEKKYYSRQYQKLKNKINIDETILKKIKSSKYYTHFYANIDK
jgi:hypothetical protein